MSEARAVVIANVAPMRGEPGSRSEQTSQAIFGETVRVHEESGEYTRIQTPDSYSGWIRSSQLWVLETDERYPNPTRAAMVSSLILPVFREPSGRSERITLLTLGTAVELADGDAGSAFFPIRFPGGEIGYLESSALIVPHYPPPEELGPNLAVVARGLIGAPYLWGGRTPFGIDCSGFTQRVYWLCGHVIPRDAYQQAAFEQFESVEKDELRTGDLVYFAAKEDPRNRGVTHVGLMVDSARFIHASGRYNGVSISPLEDVHYGPVYWGARRMKK